MTSQQELATAWDEMGRHDSLPVVDFRRHSAVFYFAGWKPNTGYSDDIERIEIRGGVMKVDVVETVPGNSCGTGQLFTAPSVAVLTIPWKGKLEPVVRTLVRECN